MSASPTTEELKSFVERKRETGISLSVLGFGRGNYNDELMQTLAPERQWQCRLYRPTLNEARKTLVAEAARPLFTIAKTSAAARVQPPDGQGIPPDGYETRQLKREDFNNDKVDAGDIGAGHTVTALYEFTPAGNGGLVDDLRYQQADKPAATDVDGEYGFLKIRYKQPDSDTSELIEVPITGDLEVAEVGQASKDTRFCRVRRRFASCCAADATTGSYSYDDVIAPGAGKQGRRCLWIPQRVHHDGGTGEIRPGAGTFEEVAADLQRYPALPGGAVFPRRSSRRAQGPVAIGSILFRSWL